MGIEAPEPPQRLAQALADEVVERRRKRGAGGSVARDDLREPRFRGFEVERIVGHMAIELLQRRDDGVVGLAIVGGRVRFPPAF